MTSKKQRTMSRVVLGVYLFLLTWLVLFKLSVNINEISGISMRSINLVPFAASAIVNNKLQLSEIIYNILVFVPLGVYVQIFKPEWNFLKKILPGLVVSVAFETIQFAFAIGASDITDVISNVLGSMMGIGLCMVLQRFFGKKYVSIVNGVGIAIEGLAFALIVILAVANLWYYR